MCWNSLDMIHDFEVNCLSVAESECAVLVMKEWAEIE